jgi:hypothetical protein
MSKRIFTAEEINTLLQNKNVSRCTEKMIIYDKGYKVWAVKRYKEGLSGSQIFKEAGFNLDLIGRKTPKYCLRRWLKIYGKEGNKGLLKDKRVGRGRPKNIKTLIKDLTDKEKIKRLELEVAYLKEENRFLAKLRKKS